jgi:hypothetical protein
MVQGFTTGGNVILGGTLSLVDGTTCGRSLSLRSMLRVGSMLSAAGSKAFCAGALSLMGAAQLGSSVST